MGQILKSVCVCLSVCQSVCTSVGTLAVAFLDRFSQKLAKLNRETLQKRCCVVWGGSCAGNATFWCVLLASIVTIICGHRPIGGMTA